MKDFLFSESISTTKNDNIDDYYLSNESSSPSLSTSSLSQDEIFEEIQRECAEIEERHSSASSPNLKVFFNFTKKNFNF